jgi:hypothetical protein
VASTGPPDLSEQALSLLDVGEPVLVCAWARIQKFGTRSGTFYPFGLVILVVDLLRNRRHMSKLRDATLGVGFTLDRGMLMVVTPKRLLIFAAHRHPRRVGAFLGQVPQARIAAALLPFSSTGPWKTVRLWLTDTTRFQFQVDARSSEHFVSALDRSATN